MTSETMKQTVTLRVGRKLGFADYGETDGGAVFHINGSGGSRLKYPADQSILTEWGSGLSPQIDRGMGYPIHNLIDNCLTDRMTSPNWMTRLTSK